MSKTKNAVIDSLNEQQCVPMKAIITRRLSATSSRPDRVVAKAEGHAAVACSLESVPNGQCPERTAMERAALLWWGHEALTRNKWHRGGGLTHGEVVWVAEPTTVVQPSGPTHPWKLQMETAWGWTDVRYSEDDGQTYVVEYFSTPEESEGTRDGLASLGHTLRLVHRDTPEDTNIFSNEGGN